MEQPKVRFRQASDSLAVHTEDEGMVPYKSKGKVKIKSIVPTSYPVKVLKNGQHVLLKEEKRKTNGCSKLNSFTSSIPSIYVTEVHTSSSENEYEHINSPNKASGNQSVPNKDDNLEECIDKLQHLSFERSLDCAQETSEIRENRKCHKSLQSTNNDESFKTCIDNDEDSDIEVIQVIENPKLLKSTKKNKVCKDNKKKNFKRENKENKTKDITTNNQQNVSKNKILKDTKNPFFDKNKTVPLKKFTKSQNKIQLMPCAKFKKISKSENESVAKIKKKQVRKSMVYDVASSHNNISVEPGTFHKKCNHPVNNDNVEKLDEKTNIASEDLLSRPEYNSAVCVMKQLKKLENEKLITDLQHLPQKYKNLIYGKVAGALDIAPYECIYKDLINISVDDNKLPTRLMRSKDPEPRDKDIVPKISDFYQPKYGEQYFVIANPAIPQPVNLNTLSAFTISNKICTWKNSRDNF